MKRLKQVLCFVTLVFLACCSCKKNSPVLTKEQQEKLHLKKLFEDWKQNEISQGRLWAPDSCNPSWLSEHDFDGMINDMWGAPKDSALYHYSYADINSDGKLDQLVTFTPDQCDGGNGSIWTRIELLTVSEKGKYKSTASLGDGLSASLGLDDSGFYLYDSIGVNKIYATFYSFNERSGHCCPSTIKPVIFAYDTKKIIYEGENEGPSEEDELSEINSGTDSDANTTEIVTTFAVNGHTFVSQQVNQEAFMEMKNASTVKSEEATKITDINTAVELLSNEVTLVYTSNESGESHNIKEIHCKNGKQIIVNDIDCYFVAYYPDYHILVCEGGHTSDLTYNVYTGEETETTGNPNYMITSADKKYRLNGYFPGQECTSYFMERYNAEAGSYEKLFDLSMDMLDICTFKEAFWNNSNTFYYSKMNYRINKPTYFSITLN